MDLQLLGAWMERAIEAEYDANALRALSTDPIARVDRNWRISGAVGPWPELVGNHEVNGLPLPALVHPDDVPALVRAGDALERATVTVPLRVRARHGYRNAIVRATPWWRGSSLILVHPIPIVERVGTVVHDLGVIVDADAAISDLIGRPATVGSSMWAHIPTRELQSVMRRFRTVALSGISLPERPTAIQRLDGSELAAHERSRPARADRRRYIETTLRSGVVPGGHS